MKTLKLYSEFTKKTKILENKIAKFENFEGNTQTEIVDSNSVENQVDVDDSLSSTSELPN